MRLVGFLKTFLVKIFSQTNPKMKTIFFRFQRFQLKTRKNENAVIFPILLSLSFFLLSIDSKPSVSPFFVSAFLLSHTKPFPYTSLHRSCSATPPPLLHRTTTATTPFPVDNLLVRFVSCLLFSPFFAS